MSRRMRILALLLGIATLAALYAHLRISAEITPMLRTFHLRTGRYFHPELDLIVCGALLLLLGPAMIYMAVRVPRWTGTGSGLAALFLAMQAAKLFFLDFRLPSPVFRTEVIVLSVIAVLSCGVYLASKRA